MLQKLPALIIICLFGSFVAHAQNRISFNELKVENAELDGKFKSYKILELDDDLQRISDGQTITISLDQDYSFTLKQNRILTHDYTTRIAGKAGVSSKTIAELGFDGQYFTNQNTTADNHSYRSNCRERPPTGCRSHRRIEHLRVGRKIRDYIRHHRPHNSRRACGFG